VDEDNEGAVKLANIPMASHMTMHIDIRHHFTRGLVNVRTIAVISIPTSDMLTDGLTKALPQPKHTILFKLCLGSLD
jgi:kynurenine formamidase